MGTVETMQPSAFELDRCAQQQVHTIGYIQPHGVLFALSEPDLLVRRVSANVSAICGMSAETVLEQSFEAVVGERQFAVFRSQVLTGEAPFANLFRTTVDGREIETQCIAHRQDGALLVELEVMQGVHYFEPLNLNVHIQLPLSRMESGSGILELSQVAARETHRLSGFDRVMIYQFDEGWNGEVIAEVVSPCSESFLGFRFPAGDIPGPVRQLFLLNRLRMIVDIDATPVPIVPKIEPHTGRELDLTCSFLRSPAPIHLEYLRNMGVQSSLTISIVVGGQLWGMIACHHTSPRQVDWTTRSVCALIGQMFGAQLALRIENAALQQRLASRKLLQSYMEDLDASHTEVYADHFRSQRLLELFAADGLVLHLDGVLSCHGLTPKDTTQLVPIVSKLRALSIQGISSSNMLATLDQSASAYAHQASGALYLGLSGPSGDYLLLLRRELSETIVWAGNPEKGVSVDGQDGLRPRASFAAWQETVRGRSLPWGDLELESARFLREQLLRIKEALNVAHIQKVRLFESLQNTERFRTVADTMPQLVWTTTPDGEADYFNKRWLSYSGMSFERSMKWGWQDAIHSDDLAHCIDRWTRSLVTGCHYEAECRIRRGSNGTYEWHLARGFPLRNHRGDVIGWFGTFTNIEGQKQARHDLEEAVAARTAELRQAQERLGTVVNGATNVAIIATDTKGVITVFNTGAENLLGYTAEEVVGKQTPGIFHLEAEVIARGLQLSAETGKEVTGFDIFVERTRDGMHEEREWTYVRKDGSRLTVTLVVTRLLDVRGMAVGFMGVAMDVTARKRAEDVLRASDEHFRLIVETVEDYALTMLDTEGRVVSWNVGAEKLKGYQANEILGRHFSRFYTPEDIASRHPDEELRIAAKQGRYTEEGWRVRKDGSRFLADVFISAIRGKSGELLGFAKVLHDITNRKQSEDRLKTAVRRLGLATDALHAGIWDWDVRSDVILWDERMCEIYGISTATPVNYQLWVSAVLPDDLASAEATLQQVIATKSQGSIEFRIKLPDGSIRYIQAAAGTILDDGGEVARLIGINIDTSGRKFNEDLERQVGERTAQLKAANIELEAFAFVASHDLKAPLRVIDNASGWLEEDLKEHLTEETRKSLNLVRSRVRRMEKLLDDLLEYARIGSALGASYVETVAGDVLLHDVLELVDLKEITLKVGPGFTIIQVCRMPLQQILTNLIGNAIKHHDKKRGCIDVGVEDRGEYYEFSVEDDGPGIAPKFHEQVFKMFQTLKPRDQVEGSGMGLAMVRKSVEVFGGALRLDSASGRGSTFRFTWPKQQRLRREVSYDFISND